MFKTIAFSLIVTFVFINVAVSSAGSFSVRKLLEQPLAAPEGPSPELAAPGRLAASAIPVTNDAFSPQAYSFYPVAGTFGRDLQIAYYVDLDPSASTLDWHCTHMSYNGSTGEDPYVRSFSEQDIGVPVYSALDGVVTAVHDGEPDHNTDSNPNAVSNFVTIQHGADQSTTYEHLRRGVIVAVGDSVTAGTQIGWVGSSGNSSGPHVHFESDWKGQPYEPMAGPCRPGTSNFLQQPQIPFTPFVVGGFFSSTDFTSVPPKDSSTHTGTFLPGQQSIFVETTLANVPASSAYALTLRKPDGNLESVAGTMSHDQEELLTVQWALNVILDQLGTWNLFIDVNGSRVATMPFTVIASNASVVNRPPNTVSVSIDPVLRSAVAVCRAGGDLFADPDYDVVRYQYVWQVNGTQVRSVTSAARSDALPRQFSSALGDTLSCSVTASDGTLMSTPTTAYATVYGAPRRRAALH